MIGRLHDVIDQAKFAARQGDDADEHSCLIDTADLGERSRCLLAVDDLRVVDLQDVLAASLDLLRVVACDRHAVVEVPEVCGISR